MVIPFLKSLVDTVWAFTRTDSRLPVAETWTRSRQRSKLGIGPCERLRGAGCAATSTPTRPTQPNPGCLPVVPEGRMPGSWVAGTWPPPGRWQTSCMQSTISMRYPRPRLAPHLPHKQLVPSLTPACPLFLRCRPVLVSMSTCVPALQCAEEPRSTKKWCRSKSGFPPNCTCFFGGLAW